jgi:hypothetical protein
MQKAGVLWDCADQRICSCRCVYARILVLSLWLAYLLLPVPLCARIVEAFTVIRLCME